jgi:hypothetical protein
MTATPEEAADFATRIAEGQKVLGLTDMRYALLLKTTPVQVWRWKNRENTPPTAERRADKLRLLDRALAKKKTARKRPPG